MVIVKTIRNGKFVTPSGSSSSNSGNSSDSRRARQEQTTKAIEDWKAGKITQEEAASRAANIRRGGGSGSAADPRLLALAQETARKQAELATARQEAIRQEALRKAQAERQAREFQQRINEITTTRAARIEQQNSTTERFRIIPSRELQLILSMHEIELLQEIYKEKLELGQEQQEL